MIHGFYSDFRLDNTVTKFDIQNAEHVPNSEWTLWISKGFPTGLSLYVLDSMGFSWMQIKIVAIRGKK